MKRADLVVPVAALAGAMLTARLGWWQLDRAAQKTALQTALDERRALPPLPAEALAREEAAAAAQHHRRIVLEGRWLPEGTVYLENRQMEGQPGFLVVTPLLLHDGSAVAVQRGWQPRDLLDRAKVVVPPTPETPVRVAGRIAPPPARLYEFDGPGDGSIRQNLDLASYARQLRLPLRPLSVVQDEGPDAPADGLRRRWAAPATGVEKHHGYAAQWFSLSALILGLYVWFRIVRPRRAR